MLRPLTFKAAAFPLLLLTVFLIWRGLLPAWSGLDTDFPNYYTAGRIILEGGPAQQLYDDNWFQEQIAQHGIDQPGKFSPFPPPTALLFVPLAGLDPLPALRVMTVFNLLLLVGALFVLARVAASRIWESALVILLSGIGLANCFRFGQLYIVLSLSLLLGFLLVRQGRPVLAGVMVGWMIPIKYFPLLILLYYAWRKEWRLVSSAVGTSVLITLLSITVLGWDVHRQFLVSVIGGHVQGIISMQDPFSSTFQSFDSLFRRLFVQDVTWNPAPVVTLPVLYHGLKAIVLAAVILVIAATLRRLRHCTDAATKDGALVALLTIAGLLVAPATATYHMLLLWLPVGLMLSGPVASGISANRFWVFLITYTAIGFVPYGRFSALDGRGLLTLLAYPRLWLLTILFVAASVAIYRRPGFSPPSATMKLGDGIQR